jgi:hypothetical protein
MRRRTEPPGRGAGRRRVGVPGRHDHGDAAGPAGGRARGSPCAPGRRDRRAHDPSRNDRVPQHLPRPAARGPLPGPCRVPSGPVRRPDAPGLRLVSFRWRHPAVPGCQLRHVRDADRPSRGAARRDAAPGLTAASAGPPRGRDVRPSRWRALRRDRPESAHGSAIKDAAAASPSPSSARLVRWSGSFSAGAGSVFPISVEAGQPGDFHQLV